eukprot:scaffold219804_cov30-Prasinocladus_malaysianus.AAC.1
MRESGSSGPEGIATRHTESPSISSEMVHELKAQLRVRPFTRQASVARQRRLLPNSVDINEIYAKNGYVWRHNIIGTYIYCSKMRL